MNPTPPTIDAPERREAVESVRDAALALVVRSRLSLATEVIKLRRALLAASSGERGAARVAGADVRAVLQLCHDTLHECTAVLTANDCAKVAVVMEKAREAIACQPVGSREALELARPIVEADLHDAMDQADADWEGMSRTALAAIDAALATPATVEEPKV